MAKKTIVKTKRVAEKPIEHIPPVVAAPVISEKEKLLALYQQLKDLNINRISQLENLIAGAE